MGIKPHKRHYTALQSQKAVSAYFTSKQIPHLNFAVQHAINRKILKALNFDGLGNENIWRRLL